MVSVTYQVGANTYTKSFDFNYAISAETFDRAFTETVAAFKRAHETVSVSTALAPKVEDTKLTVSETGVAPKKAKLAPVKMETF